MSDALQAMLEAMVFASERPLTEELMRELSGAPANEVRSALHALEQHYAARGVRLQRVAGGWQFRTDAQHAEHIARLWAATPPKLSRAMLETLAIIVYQQPVTRAEIEAIRGISVSTALIGNLLERGWIRIMGRKDVPGRPHIYGSAKQFLIDFGLQSLAELPDAEQLLNADAMQQLLQARKKHE